MPHPMPSSWFVKIKYAIASLLASHSAAHDIGGCIFGCLPSEALCMFCQTEECWMKMLVCIWMPNKLWEMERYWTMSRARWNKWFSSPMLSVFLTLFPFLTRGGNWTSAVDMDYHFKKKGPATKHKFQPSVAALFRSHKSGSHISRSSGQHSYSLAIATSHTPSPAPLSRWQCVNRGIKTRTRF